MKTQIKNIVQKEINSDNFNYAIYSAMIGILSKFDGKIISKRIETAVKAYGFNARLKELAGMYHIEFKHEGKDFSFLLGYDSNKIFKLKSDENGRGFDYFAACYGSAALDRIEKNKQILASEGFSEFCKINQKIANLQKQLESLKIGHYDFPALYAVNNFLETSNG